MQRKSVLQLAIRALAVASRYLPNIHFNSLARYQNPLFLGWRTLISLRAKTTCRWWRKKMKITLSIYLVLSKRERTCFNYRFEYYPLGAHICWYCSQYYTALNQNFKSGRRDGMRGFTGLATVWTNKINLGEIYGAYRGIASMFSFTH